jgi:hypothetical protein
LEYGAETPMVVSVLPLAGVLGGSRPGAEYHAPELVVVRSMPVLDLSIGLGVAPRNLLVNDPEILPVPGESVPNRG